MYYVSICYVLYSFYQIRIFGTMASLELEPELLTSND